MPSLFDSHDATGNTQEMDTSASEGATKTDGVGAEEQRHRRQLRRTASLTMQDGGASGSTMAVLGKPKAGQQGRAEELQQNHAEGHPQDASNDARPILLSVAHSADQGVEHRSRQHAETDADQSGKSTARGNIRKALSGLDQVSPSEGRRGGHENSTRPFDLLGSSGHPSTKPNLRRGSILQAGQGVQSRRQDNHTEHRVKKKKCCSFSMHSGKPRQSASTAELHPQPWSECDRRSWKIF